MARRLYRSTRDLHLYLGLFVSPFILLYAVTVVLLNHAYLPWGGPDAEAAEVRTVRLEVPPEGNSLEMAKAVRSQLGIGAEVGYVNLDQEERRLSFPLEKPGERTMVRMDLASGETELERRETGVWDAMVYLHTMPGPHNVAIRGNWVLTRVWGWIADLTVYLTLFGTATGVYLWATIRAERKAGLIFLGSGALSFFVLLFALLG